MKKICLSLFAFSIVATVTAQVQIQPVLPTVGLVQKSQLWDLVVINNTGSPVDGRLEMILYDRQSSQELMTATTNEFSLPKGSLMSNETKVGPVQYNYIGIEPDKNFNSLLPAGSYSVCYSFVKNPNSNKREILAEECTAFDIEPLSPPMLSFPADSSIMETSPTQFSWMPPVPAALLKHLRYEVMIMEVQPSQKAAEAIENNIPFFSRNETPNNFMTYPGAYPAFEKDKWYAWQVVAKDDNNYAGKSEVWVFKVSSQSPAQQIKTGTAYVQLQKNGAERVIAFNGILQFYYFNQLADTKVNIVVTDITDKAKGDGAKFELPVVRGENYIQRDINKLFHPQDGHLYMLTLQNSAKERWNIMFEIRKKD